MASSVLDSLPLLLIAAGFAFFAASAHLARLARGHRRAMKALLELAGRDLDPLELPLAAWPQLAAAGWLRLEWEGNWFGQPVRGALGAETGGGKTLVAPLTSGGDVALTLNFTSGRLRGEARLFAEHLARIFLLLLETRLRARTEALSAALAERARLSLYLQHDMRNLAQWVGWISTDFAACADDAALIAAARRLRDNAPLAGERAARLTAALARRPSEDSPAAVDLAAAVRQAARLAGVEADVDGEGTAWIAPGLLARALDNLFANLAAGWREAGPVRPRLRLAPADDGPAVTLEFACPWPPGSVPPPPERLFEPFVSGRPGGLGLGLYQTRKSLLEAGGDISARAGADGLGFRLRLPVPPA